MDPYLGRIVASALLPFALPCSALAQSWEPAAPLPAAKSRNFAVLFNGAILSVGGAPWRNGGDQDGSVLRFDGAVWSEVEPLTGMGPTVDQVGGVDDLGRVLVFGGHVVPSGDIGSARAYHPAKGTTEDLPSPANYPFDYVATAVDAQHRVYSIGGGYGPYGVNYGQVGRWIGSEHRWENLAYLPYTRAAVAAAFDGLGHIWIFGGYTSVGAWRIVDTSRYDIATNTWTNHGGAYLPVATADAQAVLGANGKIYVIGGSTGTGAAGPVTANVWVFDPQTITLQQGPALATARKDFGAVLGSDGYVYVIGGVVASGASTTSVERLYSGDCAEIVSQSDATEVAAGATLSLHATAAGGAPLELRWQKDGVELFDGGRVSGAATAALTVTGFSAADAGVYSVVATNPCGGFEGEPIAVRLAGAIAGDLDGNGRVDAADLAALLSRWGSGDAVADLNHDGVVGAPDLATLLSQWTP